MNFRKKSFTLIEIVVVLLIMGFIYTIGISSFSKKTIEEENYHFNLKNFLQRSLKVYDKKIELIVLDDSTLVQVDNKNVINNFVLPKDISFYSYWSDETEKDYFKPYFDDGYYKEVKFRYIVYSNQISTKCIVEKDEKFHIQSNYFSDANVFDDIYEAKEYLLNSDIKNQVIIADE